MFYYAYALSESEMHEEAIPIYDYIISKSTYDNLHFRSQLRKVEFLNLSGEYDKAQRLLDIVFLEKSRYRTQQWFRAHMVQGRIFNRQKDFDISNREYLKALSLIDQGGLQPIELARLKGNLHNNLGINYRRLKDYENAESHYAQALEHFSPDDFPNRAKVFNSLSILKYYHQDQYQEGLRFVNEAIVMKHRAGSKPPDYAIQYHNKGEIFLLLHQLDSAIHYMQKAIAVQVPGFNEMAPGSNPTFAQFTSSSFMDELSYDYDWKITILDSLIATDPSPSFKNALLSSYHAVDDLFDAIRQDHTSVQDKQYWRREAFPFYTRAITFCDENELEKEAFFFMEKAKSVLFFENQQAEILISDQDSTTKSRFESISNEIQDLIRQIRMEEHQLNDVQLAELLDSLNHLRNEQEEVMDEIIHAGDNLSGDFFNQAMIGLGSFQSSIPRNTSTLIYHLDNEVLYGLKVTRKDAELYRLPLPENFDALLASVLELISTRNAGGWERHAQELHALLIQPLGKLEDNLIIVPSNKLYYLPFEILIDHSGNMLVHNHRISYQHSIQISNYLNNRHPKNREVVSFAPGYLETGMPGAKTSPYGSWIPLIYNEAQANWLGENLGAEIFTGIGVTKQTFEERVSNRTFKLLDLALHASVNDSINDISHLVFSNSNSDDPRLYLNELASLNIQADLVNLSACETATGQLSQGEGILNMGRILIQEGCQSTLSTLWKAHDHSTFKINELFYRNLKAGKSKDEALHQAKLTYLRQAAATDSHPYYWSSIVLFGNTEPLFPQFKLIWLAGPLLLVLFALLMWWRLRRNRLYNAMESHT